MSSHPHIRRSLSHAPLAVLFCTTLLSACASAPAPKAQTTPTHTPHTRYIDPPSTPLSDTPQNDLVVKGTLGTLDPAIVQQTMQVAGPAVQRCYLQTLRTHPYVGGNTAWKVRVNAAGKIKTIVLTQSTLGSYELESCIYQQFMTVQFPRPDGGEAEFNYSLDFPTRIPVETWEPEQVAPTLSAPPAQALRAKKNKKRSVLPIPRKPRGLPKGLVLTFYLNRRGEAICAGFSAAATMISASHAQALTDYLQTLKFPEPSTTYAKVSYPW